MAANQARNVTRSSKDVNGYAEFDWYYPVRFAGMKTGSVDVGKTTTSLSPLAEKDFEITGTVLKFSLTPVVAFGVTPKNSETTKYNRKESFTIKMDKKSHLDFDVYYSKLIDSRDSTTAASTTDVFMEENFLNNVDYMEYFLDRDVGARDIVHDMVKPRGFIYRIRGGALCRCARRRHQRNEQTKNCLFLCLIIFIFVISIMMSSSDDTETNG